MPTFDDREKAFEAKFAHEADLKFQLVSRRNKLFAEWAAAELGLSGDDAVQYVRDFVRAEVGGADDGALLARVKADLMAKGIDLRSGRAESKLTACAALARDQVMAQRS